MKLTGTMLSVALIVFALPLQAQETESGLYGGLHLGYASLKPHYTEHGDDYEAAKNPNVGGARGGVLLGYGGQLARTSLGLEADFGLLDSAWTDAGRNFDDYNVFETEWNAHVRARAGFPMGNVRVFAAVGIAILRMASTDVHLREDGVLLNIPETEHLESTMTGWTAGAGIEHAAWDRAVVRLELLYDDYGSAQYLKSDAGPGKLAPSAITIRAGVSYRF